MGVQQEGPDWPNWSVENHPENLARYALPAAIATHLPIPGPSPESPIATVRLIYKILSLQHIRYADEASFSPEGEQSIRSAHAVLRNPRHGNCLDLALILGGACIHAGLQTMVIIVDPSAGGRSRHSLTCVNVGRHGSEVWPQSPPETPTPILVADIPQGFFDAIETQPGGPGEILVIDPNGLAHGSKSSPVDNLAADFSEAVVSGARYLTSPDWHWRFGVTLINHSKPYRPGIASEPVPDGILRWRSLQRIQPQSLSALLREENMLVPFMGRDSTRERLRSWCREGQYLRTAVITGAGGQGKSRLAREFMHEMSLAGWRVGYLARDPSGIASLGEVIRPAKPTVVAIDYAETRATQVDALFEELIDANPSSPLRLLLIARSKDAWWTNLYSLHYRLLESAEFINMEDLTLESGIRERMFQESISRFSRELKWMYPEDPRNHLESPVRLPEAIESPRYAKPLTLQLEAPIALLREREGAKSNPDFSDERNPLAQEFLRHDRMYWVKVARSLDLDLRPQVLDIAVASLVLFGADTRDDAMRILSTISSSEGTSDGVLSPFDTAIRLLFPSSPTTAVDGPGGYWGTFEPDLLGEWHVGESTYKNHGIIERLALGASDGQLRRALEVLRRSAQTYPHIASLLATLETSKRAFTRKHRTTLTLAAPQQPALAVEQTERVSMPKTIEQAESAHTDDRGRLNSGQL